MSLGIDPHSYANYHEALVTFIDIDLTIDFDRKILYGSTELTATVKHDNIGFLLLDTRGLSVENVIDSETNEKLLWTMPRHHKDLGVCLQIPIPKNKQHKDAVFKARVFYNTSCLSGGIQFFDPEQTRGKKYPMVYTQFEAILARTMLPCQDTPAVKAPYSIKVTVEDPLVAACSAIPVGEPVHFEKHGRKFIRYEFLQKIPIPAYLIALVAGALKRDKIGPRSNVYCEEELLQAAKHEFVDTETYLKAGEKICGFPYVWNTYDILLLPGAFPYGGMENPNLTFISSSLITGDRSLMSVVAHEITHSWAGNLVTNANWKDFWLNEGFTMYIERLILGEVYGEDYRHFHAMLGYGELVKTCSDLADIPEYTKLQPNLEGVDPDDAFSRIPYEKGFLLLLYFESLVGGKDKMIEWIQIYFKDFAYKSVTTEEMKKHFMNHFGASVKQDWDAIWDHWLNGVGLPNWNPTSYLDQKLNQKCDALTAIWKEKNGEGATSNDLNWDANQTMVVLDNLLNNAVPMKHDILQKMDDLYHLSTSNNVEVAFRWFMLNLRSNKIDIMPQLEQFLSQHGRGVYVKPLYKQLIEMGKQGTIPAEKPAQLFNKNRAYYHSVIHNYVQPMLKK
jgi:leukotriene-A4 hydrolase